ncbi:FAD-dependent monooxygenase [Actinopolymorpha pittospori]|uniref:2-polyprenyl-6-methoxyphenol hydroxylase-like FAD-dependent oxidoreductase n=1 Tax=Actinopolymorpha pittospori TaxID=648752 RepID=A0A927MV91_9ACTN|nr:FAD-dependent monooxygenase [Actinopolymorpha pittospori]MBE1607520.1 2-polyprenyl-6-methoxyphenol hydroxylase-like FAD-dependent oxidoreductase [Actinopolymorpha pittospori]
MNAVRTALVIGGGIAGPVTALALRKAGIEATVYEAYASSADGIGGTLQVAPNGLDSLRIIGADKAVREVGLPMVRTVMADGRGRRMAEFSGLTGLPPSRAMSRPELYRILHDHAVEAGIRIEHGRRLVGVDDTSTGITARFADGSTAHGDILVGADGIRSTVRTLIDPGAPPPRHVPLLNIGATADIAAPGEPDATYFVFGRRAFLGYWLQPDGRTAWYSNLPHPHPMSVAQARAVPAADWHAKLREVYADDLPGADLVRHTRPDELVVLGTVEMLPTVRRWHRGRMVLVGDSVHAPSPSSGQGASLATESAIQLARCLRDIADVPAAFTAYERLRRPRVEKVAAAAARVNSSKGLGPVAKAMMSLLMPVATRTFLKPERTFGPVQRYRIDWDEKVTR